MKKRVAWSLAVVLALAGTWAKGAEIKVVGDDLYDVTRCPIQNLDAWRRAVDAEPGLVICATPVPRGLRRDSGAGRAAQAVAEEVFKLADNKRILYLDVRPAFCGKDGVNPAYYEADGLTLNAAGKARLEQLYQPLRAWAASGSTNTPPATKFGYKSANTSRIHFRRSSKEGGARWWWERVMEKMAQRDRLCRENDGKLDVLFIGDSLSHRWEWADSGAPVYERLCRGRRVMNMAIGGDGRRSQRWLIDNGLIDGLQAKLVSICLGANDHNYKWSDDTPTTIAKDIGALVARIRRQMPDAKIVVTPINRRLTGTEEHAAWWKNDEQTNARLAKLADGQHVFFVDVGEPLRQAVGREAELSKTLTTDGTHLSRKMYEHWYTCLKPYLPEPQAAQSRVRAAYENRWVFAIDYLNDPVELEQVQSLVVRAQAAGYTGLALISGKDYTSWTDEGERNDGSMAYRASRTGLEGLSVMAPERVARFKALKAFCEERGFDLVPLIWSTGYCSMQYADPSLVTVWPVRDIPYDVRDGRGVFAAQPVEADFSKMTRTIDCSDKDARNNETVAFAVKPCRKYRVSARLKTEGVLCAPKPGNTGPCLGIVAKSCRSSHYAAASYPQVKATQDWTLVGFTFITGQEDTEVQLVTRDRSDTEGRVHFADVRVEEIGVEYPVFRAGTDFVVRDAQTGATYREGIDYRRPTATGTLQYAKREPAWALEILPGGAIREEARLLVSCYEPKCVYNSQFGTCLTNPALNDYYRRSAADLAREIGPKKWFLSADEIRISCRCANCLADGETMGVRIGRHIRAQYEAIKAACPEADVYMWPDMLDVHHNALPVYYLMDSPTLGALPFVPKDITMVCWWMSKAKTILPHFASHGYRTMGAGYYDAETSSATRDRATQWAEALNETPGARGFIYTTWDYGIGRNHAFIEDYANVFRAKSNPK